MNAVGAVNFWSFDSLAVSDTLRSRPAGVRGGQAIESRDNLRAVEAPGKEATLESPLRRLHAPNVLGRPRVLQQHGCAYRTIVTGTAITSETLKRYLRKLDKPRRSMCIAAQNLARRGPSLTASPPEPCSRSCSNFEQSPSTRVAIAALNLAACMGSSIGDEV